MTTHHTFDALNSLPPDVLALLGPIRNEASHDRSLAAVGYLRQSTSLRFLTSHARLEQAAKGLMPEAVA